MSDPWNLKEGGLTWLMVPEVSVHGWLQCKETMEEEHSGRKMLQSWLLGIRQLERSTREGAWIRLSPHGQCILALFCVSYSASSYVLINVLNHRPGEYPYQAITSSEIFYSRQVDNEDWRAIGGYRALCVA